MGSTRLLVLAFVRQYFARWGQSPSQGEIANGLNLPRDRVRKALKRLSAQGHLLRQGGERGLALPGDIEAAAALLRSVGYTVTRPVSPLPPGGQVT
jgi:DNA-binding IclR family transcriptional regulator